MSDNIVIIIILFMLIQYIELRHESHISLVNTFDPWFEIIMSG